MVSFFHSIYPSSNEAPRSLLQGITELKQLELPEIFARLPLPLYVPLARLPVRSLSYRRHICTRRSKILRPTVLV